ncbi:MULTISPECIES: Cys-tRNA(Pro) deacylase [Pseudoalteromonas]|uniref:Cys-tRNA(Pro)/Cys-tRNA(Cys) deacylase n=1 Tax=Pseudoalteromonas amylolytica TaxID=1859457 RepID=A0A1S1N0X0_9GAMM|nr:MULTISPECIES: Cys-tRNA(Pro) deacylase [Pseudoalteromonas]OHU85368.1 aminoacyl-tRNA deacylase [Pseudoalteromonas sp. JW3]OHU93011.1 aminoacyl-tRNA deacylase [Pseudoalteromonas amylolytica]
MTPAINLLEKQGVQFQILKFEHEPSQHGFANEAAEKLGLIAEQVFKTLLVEVDGVLNVAILPATRQVDLKAFAKACKGKKAIMADAKKAQTATGYLIGGISPFAQKKRFNTLLHSDAKKFGKIYVSAGKRGLEVEVAPEDLVRLCNAQFRPF